MAVLLPTLRKLHPSALLSLLQEPAPGSQESATLCHTQATPWPCCRQCWDLQFCHSRAVTRPPTATPRPGLCSEDADAFGLKLPAPGTLAFSAFHAAQRLPRRQLCSFFSRAKRLRSNERSPRRESDLPCFSSLIFYGQNRIFILPQESEVSLSLRIFTVS